MAGRRRSDRALRPKLKSPGRPPVARQDHRRRFWALIAEGLSSEDATMAVGISQPVGTRWFRQAGGMAPSHLARTSVPVSGRYLAFAEREEIALWRAQGLGVREVARRLGRSASTVSRELRRNAATRNGNLDYLASTAQWHAERAACRPEQAKLAANPALREYVQDRLAGAVVAPGGLAAPGPVVPWKGRRHGRRQSRRWAMAWSPQQIAERLRLDFPDDSTMRVSHEAIYQALYVQGRSAAISQWPTPRWPRAADDSYSQKGCRAHSSGKPIAPGVGGKSFAMSLTSSAFHPEPGATMPTK